MSKKRPTAKMVMEIIKRIDAFEPGRVGKLEWYVYIVRFEDRKIFSAMGAMTELAALKVQRGALINLNRADFFLIDSKKKYKKGGIFPEGG